MKRIAQSDAVQTARTHVRRIPERIALLAEYMETAVSLLVLAGLLLSMIPVVRELVLLPRVSGTMLFQTFLGHAFSLVIGIEFIKMLAKHSPGIALEVLLYAIARHMILGTGSSVENLLGVIAIGLIFLIRKFCFVPSFTDLTPEDTQPAAHPRLAFRLRRNTAAPPAAGAAEAETNPDDMLDA